MRILPDAHSLQQAVHAVIASNKDDGYTPIRFMQITANGHTPDLLPVCEGLIANGATLEYIDKALQSYPTLLTLEDYVARSGGTWGFSPETFTTAQGRVLYFDTVAGARRYA
jgi:hypothetical protein